MKYPLFNAEERLSLTKDTFIGSINRFRFAFLKTRQIAYKKSWFQGFLIDLILKRTVLKRINKQIKKDFEADINYMEK